MRNLPFPSTITGWRFALLLVVSSFLIYYLYLFDGIYDTYYKTPNRVVIPFDYRMGQNELSLELTLPESLAYFDTEEFIVTLSSKEQVDEVKVTIEADGLLLCYERFFTDCIRTKTNTIRFDSLEAGEKQTYALWVMVEPKHKKDKIDPINPTLKVKNQSLDPVPVADSPSKNISVDKRTALWSAFLRTLLLPPWSNGFIPSLALVFTALIEHKIQPNPRLRRVENWKLPKRFLGKLKNLPLIKRLSQEGIMVQLFVWLFVIILYVSLCSALYFLLVSDFLCLIVSAIFLLLSVFFVWSIVDNTDIGQADPLYRQNSAGSPQGSGSSSGNGQSIHNALTQINTTLESIAQTTMVEASTHDQQMKAIADSLDKNHQVTEELVAKLGILTDLAQQQTGFLQQLIQHVQDLLHKSQTMTVNRSSLLDYSFNHLSLFNDSGLVNVFRVGLPALSSDQFQEKLTDQQFAFCILSLFVLAREGKWDDIILIDNKSLRGWMQKHSFWEKLFEGWLDDLARDSQGKAAGSPFARAVDAIVKWMLHLEVDQVERYIFNVLPHKCPPQMMVSIFNDYQDIYRSLGRLSDIKWKKVLNYFVQFSPATPLPDNTLIEKVWYPDLSSPDGQTATRTSESLWKIVSQEKPLTVKEWTELYTGILKWLCAIPIGLAQRVADDIYQFYKDDRSLARDSDLAKFVQSYNLVHQGNSPFADFIQRWCNNQAKPQTFMNSSRPRRRR